MGGSEDAGGGVSGEEAAWRDLIARFDLPVDTEADVPWPARENLTETARERQRPGPPGPGGRPGPASIPDRLPGPGSASDGPGTQGWPGGEADDLAAWSPWVTDPGPAGPGLDDDPGPDDTSLDETGLDETGPDDTGPDDTGPDDTSSQIDIALDPPGATRPRSGGGQHRGAPAEGSRIIRRARFTVKPTASVPPPAAPVDDDLDDEDDRYRPPPPGPLPRLDPMAKAAWLGLLGGPGYLLAATLVGWQVSDWSALVAIVAFVAGFAILVLRLGDKPHDDDDGAVI